MGAYGPSVDSGGRRAPSRRRIGWICTNTWARTCSEPTGSRRRAGSLPRRPTKPAAATEQLGGSAVVKVQVQVGGRGKGGGVVALPIARASAGGRRAHARDRLQGPSGHPRPRRGAPADRPRVLHVGAARPLGRRLPLDADRRGRHGHRDARNASGPRRSRACTSIPDWACARGTFARWSGSCPGTRATERGDVLRSIWSLVREVDATLVEINPLGPARGRAHRRTRCEGHDR